MKNENEIMFDGQKIWEQGKNAEGRNNITKRCKMLNLEDLSWKNNSLGLIGMASTMR